MIRRCATDFKQCAEWPILNTKMVGGPCVIQRIALARRKRLDGGLEVVDLDGEVAEVPSLTTGTWDLSKAAEVIRP